MASARLPKKDLDGPDQSLARAAGVQVVRASRDLRLVWPDLSPLRSRAFDSVVEAWDAVPKAFTDWSELLPYLEQAWAGNLYLHLWHEPHDEPHDWTAMLCSVHEKRAPFAPYGVRLVGECYGVGDTKTAAISSALLELYGLGKLPCGKDVAWRLLD